MGCATRARRASLFATAALAAGQPSFASDNQQNRAPPPVEQPGDAQAVPPAAVEPDEPVQEVTQTIVVTGSRIPRPNLTAVSPVTVVGQQEVKLQGATMAEELLNQLPQVAPAQGAFISNGSTGIATVDLRNLGASRTLVLINGRRLGPGDPATPLPDLNMVPTSLISRVEVLTGGASSVYGSDALSGVVNFVLNDRLDGLRIDAQASVFQHDNRNGSGLADALDRRRISYPVGNTVDGGREDINAAIGRSFFDGRAHLTLYAGYRHLEALTQAERDYSACAAQVSEQDNTVLNCGGSIISYPGNFITSYADSNSFPGIFMLGPGRTFEPGFTSFNFAPWNYYQRPDRRWTAGGFADAEISTAVKPYVEVMALDDRSVAQIAPSANFANTQMINCDNPLLSAQQLSLVCITGNFVGEEIFFDNEGNLLAIEGSPIDFPDPVTGGTYNRAWLIVLRRGVDTGPRRDDLRHRTLRLLGGVKGDLGRGVSYDASFLRARSSMKAKFSNDYSITRLRRSIDVVADPATGQPACRSALTGLDPDCAPWDIFTLNGVSDAANAYVSTPSLRSGSVTEQVANANATVDLSQWGLQSPWTNDTAAMNFGAEYRRDSLSYRPDPAAADLAGGTAEFPVDGSVNVKELFAEARIPLLGGRIIEALAIEGGYRYSWYKNPVSTVTSNAYKLAADLTAVRGLRFRASQHRAVRAPNVIELFTPPALDFFLFDRCAGAVPQASQQQCAATGVSDAQYGRILRSPGSFGYNSVIGGNPGLVPEKATTRTLGLVLEPRAIRGFNATVDWWSIDLKGAIEQIGAQNVMDTCIATADPFFCSRIHRDSGGSLWLTTDGFIDDTGANIGSIEVRGVDIGMNYRRPLGRFGTAILDFNGSRLDKFTVDNGGLSTPLECAGKVGFLCIHPTPKWRHKARMTWEPVEQVALSLNWRFTGKMSVVPVPDLAVPGPLSRLPARSYFDLSALFRVQNRFVFRLGVNNVFDSEPPLVPNGEGAGTFSSSFNGNTYPQWYDPLGRFLFAGFTATF